MSRREERMMARMAPKRKFEPRESPFAKFGKDWILSSKTEKTIYILGFFCILWKIFDIVILGRFP